MAKIKLDHNYTIPREELHTKLDELAEEMGSRYQLECKWESDDCISFKRSGAAGEINIDDKQLSLSMKLGMMLAAFKGPIERDIKNFITKNIH